MVEPPEFLEWGPERVYLAMAIARQGENEDITANNRPCHRSVIREREDYSDTIEQLRHWCQRDDLTYRIYCSVNARNVIKASFNLRASMDNWLRMQLNGHESSKKNWKKIDSEFKSALQRADCRDDKYFMFDVDNDDLEGFIELVLDDDYEELYRTKSPNGVHLVSEPFRADEYEKMLKTDAMFHVDKL